MSVQVKECPSCNSSHIGIVPCGMSYVQRLRSQTVDTSWMPSQRQARQAGEKEYYDDDALTELFQDGLTGEERKEELMEETKGIGTASAEEVAADPELVDAVYLSDPADVVGED